jgi:hypothetical protein
MDRWILECLTSTAGTAPTAGTASTTCTASTNSTTCTTTTASDAAGGSARRHSSLDGWEQLPQPTQRGGSDDTVRAEPVGVLEILDPDQRLVAEHAVGHEKRESRLLVRKGGVGSNLVQRVLHRGDVSSPTTDR